MDAYHIPVLLHPSIDLLNLKPGGVYMDATFGGGGHSREILRRLQGGSLLAFDKDPDAAANLPDDPRLRFIAEDFRFFEKALQAQGIDSLDGILADLGVSSHQFDTAERGFSFRFDGPLDMRMNPLEGRSAADFVNSADEKKLIEVLRNYGEISNAREAARRIIAARARQPLRSTQQLERALGDSLPAKKRNQYLAQVFQALRIEVNRELEALQALLEGATRCLKPGGRLVIISYHSLEDRFVKLFLRSGNLAGVEPKDLYGRSLSPWKPVTRQPVAPDESETEHNPRARSARLRAGERCIPEGDPTAT